MTHLVLTVSPERSVDDLTSQLSNDGFEVVDGPRSTDDGYYGASFWIQMTIAPKLPRDQSHAPSAQRCPVLWACRPYCDFSNRCP
jgi:hypothetical protein